MCHATAQHCCFAVRAHLNFISGWYSFRTLAFLLCPMDVSFPLHWCIVIRTHLTFNFVQHNMCHLMQLVQLLHIWHYIEPGHIITKFCNLYHISSNNRAGANHNKVCNYSIFYFFWHYITNSNNSAGANQNIVLPKNWCTLKMGRSIHRKKISGHRLK